MSSIEQQFDRSATSTLYADLSLLHSRNFDHVPLGAMKELHKHLLKFDDGATVENYKQNCKAIENSGQH